MKNILPTIRKEKAKLLHWHSMTTTTREERQEITKRYKRLTAIESKIMKKFF